MIYQPEIETMESCRNGGAATEALQETVAYVYERVPMYKERLDALRVKPEDIKSLDDIRRLPLRSRTTCAIITLTICLPCR